MDKRFQNRIVKALKERREELHQQLVDIADLLDMFAGKPKPEPIKRRPWSEVNAEKVLALLQSRSSDQSDWMSATEIRKKTGLSSHGVGTVMLHLVSIKRVEHRTINKITHYRYKPEEVRIVAGDGVLTPPRMVGGRRDL